MKIIALEESFWYEKLATEGSNTARAWLQLKSAVAADWQRKLADFTEYRLPDMDRNGVDMQVLSTPFRSRYPGTAGPGHRSS